MTNSPATCLKLKVFFSLPLLSFFFPKSHKSVRWFFPPCLENISDGFFISPAPWGSSGPWTKELHLCLGGDAAPMEGVGAFHCGLFYAVAVVSNALNVVGTRNGIQLETVEWVQRKSQDPPAFKELHTHMELKTDNFLPANNCSFSFFKESSHPRHYFIFVRLLGYKAGGMTFILWTWKQTGDVTGPRAHSLFVLKWDQHLFLLATISGAFYLNKSSWSLLDLFSCEILV